MTATVPAPRFSLNFEEAIRFLGRDRHWFQKIALGAVFSLFSFLIIGGILVQGYLLIFAERVSRAEPDPLPEWEDYGEILRKGIAGFIVSLVYSLPIILLAGVAMLLVFVPLIVVSSSSSRNSGAAGGFASLSFILFMFILIPLILLVAIVIPAAHAQLVLHDGDLAAAFRLGDVFRFMRRHLGQYALLLLLSYAASSLLNQIGYFACFVGIFVTTFLAQLFQYHLIGQLCWYDRTVLGVPRRGE
jgi:hypothetical protein